MSTGDLITSVASSVNPDTITGESLRSTSYARGIDLLCEGPIRGLVDLAQVYFEETPLKNPDGTYNFQGVKLYFTDGAIDQGYLGGFTATESLTSIGLEVKEATPIVRSVSNLSADAVSIIITVPQLTRTDRDTGDVVGTSVRLQVHIQPSGGTWQLAGDISIVGKTSSQYQREARCELPGTGPWNVRVTRLTPDSTDQYRQNKTYWASMTEIMDEKLNYPHSALAAWQIDAQQVPNIPRRAYRIKGLKVKVPTNYDPDSRVYGSTWDGTFKTMWTDNPAWCFYDLLTNPRYGLGKYVGNNVDKWALYQIGKYCDELVPDGFGGTEPRFRCNLFLSSRAEAYKVVQDFAALFNGMVFWASGSITAIQDAPGDPVALYAPANVIDGSFTYSGTSAKARHTAALITWNDPDDLHRPKVEYVEDTEGVQRYGLIPTELAAIGCSSRGQAHRVGKWLLFSERLQTEVVTFKVGLDSLFCRPGQVIKVADPARAGVRYGGRIKAATTTVVTIDAPVTLQAGQTYTLSCLRADLSVMESTVTTAASTTATLTVSPALPEAPAAGSMWVLASASVQAQLFRVLSVAEVEPGKFDITALAHDPSKYAAIEQGLKLQTRSISVLKAKPDAPTNLVVSEALYARGSVLATRLDVSWTAPAGANAFAVTWRRTDGTVSPERIVYDSSVEIDGAQEGQVYGIDVYAINPLGARSTSAASVSHTVLGKLAKPSGVAGFVVARTKDQLAFSWRPISDLDAELYEIRLGATWDTAVVVGSAPHPTNALTITSPRGGTYLIKARDTSGGYSDTAAVVVAPDVLGINVVVSQDEGQAGFLGVRDNTTLLSVSGTPSWDAIPSWGAWTSWDTSVLKSGLTLVSGATSGTYVTQTMDLGIVAYSLVALDVTVETMGTMYLPWASYTAPWSSYTGPWQAESGTVSSAFEVRTSLDGLVWTPWSTFLPGAYQFRFIEFRLTLGTSDPGVRPFVTKLMINIDVPDRQLSFADVVVPDTGKTLTFSPAFVGVSTVQITLQSANPGDNATVTGKSADAVTVQIYNSAGVPVAGMLDIDVFGYGERY